MSILFISGITFNFYKPFVFTKWQSTSLPTMAMALLLLSNLLIISKLLINQFQKLKWEGINHLVLLISKSTFHIYLIQMIFYGFHLNAIIPIILQPFINVIICIFLGVLFYLIEYLIHKIFRNLKNKLHKLNSI